MEIKEIFIYSFGRLKGLRLKLNSGLNEIYKENGYGKTTLTIFIKAMLYGIKKEERVKYLPWDNPSSFGGEMKLSLGSRGYKVVREFDSKKEKLDRLHVFSLDSNEEIKIDGSLGEYLLGLNEEGFTRSAFIPDYEVEGFGDDIECRLASLIGGSDDIDAYSKAIEALEGKSKELRMNSKKGQIIDLNNKINEIDNSILEYEGKLQGLDNVKRGIERIEGEKESLLNKKAILKEGLNEASVNIDNRIKTAIMARLKGEINSKRGEVNNINTKLNNKNPSLAELSSYKAKCKEYDELSLNRLDIKRPTSNDLREVKRIYPRVKNKVSKKISKALALISLPLIIMGIALIILFLKDSSLSLIGIIVTLFGILILLLSMIKRDNSKEEERIREILAGYKIYKESLDEGVYLFEGLSLDNSNERINELDSELKSYFSGFSLRGDNYNDLIIELEDLIRTRKLLIADVNNKINEYNSYLKLNNSDNKEIDIKDINSELDKLDKRLDTLARDLGVLKNELAKESEIESIINSLMESKEEYQSKLKRSEDELRLISLAKEYLAKANTKILNTYLRPMKESLDRYLILLKEIDGYSIDTSFNLAIETDNGSKDIKLLSKGLKSIIYFLMRLALIDILYEEKPFIILDDPFISLDDENLELARSLVKRVARDRQIIYFTCIKERCIN